MEGRVWLGMRETAGKGKRTLYEKVCRGVVLGVGAGEAPAGWVGGGGEVCGEAGFVRDKFKLWGWSPLVGVVTGGH